MVPHSPKGRAKQVWQVCLESHKRLCALLHQRRHKLQQLHQKAAGGICQVTWGEGEGGGGEGRGVERERGEGVYTYLLWSMS